MTFVKQLSDFKVLQKFSLSGMWWRQPTACTTARPRWLSREGPSSAWWWGRARPSPSPSPPPSINVNHHHHLSPSPPPGWRAWSLQGPGQLRPCLRGSQASKLWHRFRLCWQRYRDLEGGHKKIDQIWQLLQLSIFFTKFDNFVNFPKNDQTWQFCPLSAVERSHLLWQDQASLSSHQRDQGLQRLEQTHLYLSFSSLKEEITMMPSCQARPPRCLGGAGPRRTPRWSRWTSRGSARWRRPSSTSWSRPARSAATSSGTPPPPRETICQNFKSSWRKTLNE